MIEAAGLVRLPGRRGAAHPSRPSDHVAPRGAHTSPSGPRRIRAGMACGGTTSHIDFCLRAAGGRHPERDRAAVRALERQLSRGLHPPRDPGRERCPCACSSRSRRPSSRAFPSFKVFTTNVLPPHPQRAGEPPRLRADPPRHGAGRRPHGGGMAVHGEDEDLVQFNYERFRSGDRMAGEEPAPRAHQAVRVAVVPAHGRSWPRPPAPPCTSCTPRPGKGSMTVAEARAAGLPVYAGDAPPVRLLQRPALQDATRDSAPTPTRPSSFRRTRRRSGTAWSTTALSALATDEYPTHLALKLRGTTIEDVTGGNLRAEARPRHRLHRGRGQAQHDACPGSPRSPPPTPPASSASTRARGSSPPAAMPTSSSSIPSVKEDPHAGRLPRERLQSVGGLGRLRLAGDDPAPGPG